MRHRIAIFCSGNGTNAEKIIEYFQNRNTADVALLLANRPDAGALQRAARHGVPTKVFSRADFYDTDTVLEALRRADVTNVVLAGFLWLVPPALLRAYPARVLNVHPALLPAFGGKGMYGARVHRAVRESGVDRTGITIHLVDEEYDHGPPVFQAECPVYPDDTPDTIAARVRALEHEHFAPTVERYLSTLSAAG